MSSFARTVDFKVFGRVTDDHFSILETSMEQLLQGGAKFVISDQDKLLAWVEENCENVSDQIAVVNRVYWTEILTRFYFANSTALMRTVRWLQAIEGGLSSSNYFGFCASVRGFLESACDYLYSIGFCHSSNESSAAASIALTLAVDRAQIVDLLEGYEIALCVNKKMEDALLHFQFADRQSEYLDIVNEEEKGLYRPKTLTKYIESVEIDGLLDVYSELCGITHPSAKSLFVLMAEDSDNKGVPHLAERDIEAIQDFIARNGLCFERLFSAIFNTLAASFVVLNHYPIDSLHLGIFDGFNIGYFTLGKKIEDALSASGVA